MAKRTKVDADYGRGMLRSHCGPMFHDDRNYCRHFIPKVRGTDGSCDVVMGQIDADHWCKLYERVKAKSS